MLQDSAAVDKRSEAHRFVDEVGRGAMERVVGGRELGELSVDPRCGEHDLWVAGLSGVVEDGGADLGG